MRFRSGLLGTMICVVAIMGTVVIGYASTVYESTEYVTEYTYITDITGIFETERSPTYIEYSPSGNWTGYYTDEDTKYTDGIDYTESSVASIYVIPHEEDETEYGTVDLLTDEYKVKEAVDQTIRAYVPPTYISADAYYHYNVTLRTFLESIGLSTTATAAYVTISGFTTDSPEVSNGTRLISTGSILYNYGVATYPWSKSGAVSYVTVNIAEESATVTNEYGVSVPGYSLDDLLIISSSAATETSVTVTYIPSYSAIYMNIQDGISLSSSPVTWSNGYETSKIQILMVRPDKTSEFQTTWTFTLGSLVFNEDVEPYGQWNYVEGSDTVQITAYSDAGQTIVYVYENGVEVASYDLTSWSRWIVEYDAVDGVVYLTPLTTYNSMVSYSEYKTITLCTLSVSGVFDDAVVTW